MIYYLVPIKTEENFNKNLKPSLEKTSDNKKILLLDGDKGICSKYNSGLEQIKNDLKENDVVVFLHDDIVIHDQKINEKLELYFKYKKNVGLAGVIGAKVYYKNNGGGWWHCQRGVESVGRIIQGTVHKKSFVMEDKRGMFDNLVIVDGCILFMPSREAKTFRFDEQSFTKYHFYDCDACFTFLKNGKDIGTVDIEIEHLSEGALSNDWFKERDKFLNKWKELPDIVIRETFKK